MSMMSMMRQLVRKARVCIRLCAVCFALCFGCLFLSEQALATEVGGAEAETITVIVAIYDYTAGTAGLEAASRTGVVLPPYSLEVPADSMAVDAIEAALQKNYISFTAPEGDYGRYFVEINGLAELDGGPESGWVFRINDVYGNSGVAATELAEGDRLILDYSIEGYGADVGNYWDGFPTFSSLTLAGVEMVLTSETVYDPAGTATTTYYLGEGEQRQVLSGAGTKADPFRIQIPVKEDLDRTQLSAEYTTALHEKYRQVSPDITQPQPYTQPLLVTLSTAGGTLETYYQITLVTDQEIGYTDVPANHWASAYVYDLTDRKIVQGNPDGSFGVEENVKRCDFVTMLYRMSGEAAPVAGVTFTDVAEAAYYGQAVAWAVQAGVTSGRTETTFGPEQPISRQEIATMLYRYGKHIGKVTEKMDVDRLDQYSDGRTTATYALEAMEWCLDIGLLNGYGDGTLAPAAPATRGAVAKMTACLLTWIEQQ